MNHADPKTLENIDKAATAEFINRGFRDASLRNIASEAGVTTGAFYGYYKGKEDVYRAIVGKHAKYLKELFSDSSGEDYKDFGKSRFIKLIVYTFDNIDGMRLLVSGSSGSSYEDLFHELTKLMTDGIKRQIGGLSEDFIHSLLSGLFASYKELVIHDAGRCEAGAAMYTLWEFYEAGWNKILKKE